MVTENAQRKIDDKKLLSLQKQCLVLENKLHPRKYTWRAFKIKNEVYLKFANDMVYPAKLVGNIVNNANKVVLKSGLETVGLILELPSDLELKKKQKAKSPVILKKVPEKASKTTKKPIVIKTRPSKSKAKPRKR